VAFQSLSPTTGELLAEFPATRPELLERTLVRAEAAWREWRDRSFDQRAAVLSRAATLLRARKADYARLMALEMGKPLAQGETEAEKCAWACDFYAAHAGRLLAPQAHPSDAAQSYVRFDPIGLVLAVMPWNFPFWQVMRCAVPTLAAGNGCVLKHAPNVPQCALALERLFAEAGCPEGLVPAVFLEPDAIGRLIEDDRIRGVTLTGSPRAGASVAAAAGRALKKTVLELGGSDPFIVLDDADVGSAARAAADARLQNSGQSCIAAKRFIVLEGVAAPFLDGLKAAMAARRVGDPLGPGTEIGPQARVDLRATLHRQVEDSLARGAELVLGGRLPDGPGAFYPASILLAVPEMPVFDEETFGPVAAVVRARDDRHALELANRSTYGLGAAVWTASPERAARFIAGLEVGMVFVNGVVKSDPRLPFGGVKASGYGRELAQYGLREFVNVKSVAIA